MFVQRELINTIFNHSHKHDKPGSKYSSSSNVSDTNLCKTWHHNAQMVSSCQNQFLVRVRGSEPVFPLT